MNKTTIKIKRMEDGKFAGTLFFAVQWDDKNIILKEVKTSKAILSSGDNYTLEWNVHRE